MSEMAVRRGQIRWIGFTVAKSNESASAFEDVTSKLTPTAAAVWRRGSSILGVGAGWRLEEGIFDSQPMQ